MFWDGCSAASLEECMLMRPPSMSTKRLRTGCAARSRALAVIMPRLLQRSAKERLNPVWCYDETAGQRYRVTLLKGFELKEGFLRFVARMWLACVGRVDGSFLTLRLCGAHLLDDLFHRGVDTVFLSSHSQMVMGVQPILSGDAVTAARSRSTLRRNFASQNSTLRLGWLGLHLGQRCQKQPLTKMAICVRGRRYRVCREPSIPSDSP